MSQTNKLVIAFLSPQVTHTVVSDAIVTTDWIVLPPAVVCTTYTRWILEVGSLDTVASVTTKLTITGL